MSKKVFFVKDWKIGDLVEWKLDGDIGIIVDISQYDGEICIHWNDEPHKGGYYRRDHPTLRKVT